MGISKRYFAEMSQSFRSGSQSAQSGAFVSAGVTASFHQVVQSLRLNLTGNITTFCLTPSGSGRALVTSVIHHPNNTSTEYSMSYGIFHNTALGPIGGVNLFNHPGGYFTGVINGGGQFKTAALNTDPAKVVINAGCVPYLSSTNHTGVMGVTIFYKVEVV